MTLPTRTLATALVPVMAAAIVVASHGAAARAQDRATAAPDPYADSTLTKVGDTAPELSFTLLDGTKVTPKDLRGKVVLVNFFATWCGPCNAELPHLQKDLRETMESKDFVLVCIGREHRAEELSAFREQKKLDLPMAPDPKREIYGRFATKYIPRNYVIGPDGKIAFQSVGFSPEEFKKMREVIDACLAKCVEAKRDL